MDGKAAKDRASWNAVSMFTILQFYLRAKSLPNEFDRLGIQNVALINSFFIGTAGGGDLWQDSWAGGAELILSARWAKKSSVAHHNPEL